MKSYPILFGLMAAVLPLSAPAEVPSDQHVQSDRLLSPDLDYRNTYAVGEVVSLAQLKYVESLLEREYPVRSIYLHATAQGISLSDATYLLTSTKPERAREFYAVAVDLMPSLPGWSCGDHPDIDLRYPMFYPASSLGSAPSVREVANRFFRDGRQVGFKETEYGRWGFPDITKGQFHFQADIDELIALARSEVEIADGDIWWYQTGPGTQQPGSGGMPVLVSLYKFDKSHAMDASVEQLERLRASGVRKVPVAIIYNDSYALPLSRACRVGEENAASAVDTTSDLLTIRHVASSYFECRRRITPPREWHNGDFHILALFDEIDDIFYLPSRQEIAPERWEQLTKEVTENGFHPPMLVTLNLESGLMWANDRAKAAAAASLGMERIPVVFLFHELSREDCYATPECEPAVCRAAVAAGGDFSEKECADVYEEWLRNHGGHTGNDIASGKRANIEGESAETVEILNKAAEQIR